MSKILYVTMFKNTKGKIKHHVYYLNNRHFVYDDTKCMPKTVVRFLLLCHNVQTIITDTGTITRFYGDEYDEK